MVRASLWQDQEAGYPISPHSGEYDLLTRVLLQIHDLFDTRIQRYAFIIPEVLDKVRQPSSPTGLLM